MAKRAIAWLTVWIMLQLIDEGFNMRQQAENQQTKCHIDVSGLKIEPERCVVASCCSQHLRCDTIFVINNITSILILITYILIY